MKFMVSEHATHHFGGYYSTAPAVSDASLKKLSGQLPKAEESTLGSGR